MHTQDKYNTLFKVQRNHMVYDALIAANGDIPSLPLWQMLNYKKLIATDGAAGQLLTLGLTPDIIIGDMDSLTMSHRFHSSQIITSFDQETTDFEKALQFATTQGYQRVLVLGALGKLADHGLHNLCLVARYARKLALMLFYQTAEHYQWIFALKKVTTIHTQIGDIFSFIPFPQATLSSQGLHWPLHHTRITQQNNHAVRNKATAQKVMVYCQGRCLCFLSGTQYPPLDPF